MNDKSKGEKFNCFSHLFLVVCRESVRCIIFPILLLLLVGCTSHVKTYSGDPLPPSQIARATIVDNLCVMSIDGKRKWGASSGISKTQFDLLPGTHEFTFTLNSQFYKADSIRKKLYFMAGECYVLSWTVKEHEIYVPPALNSFFWDVTMTEVECN